MILREIKEIRLELKENAYLNMGLDLRKRNEYQVRSVVFLELKPSGFSVDKDEIRVWVRLIGTLTDPLS